jgi:hypothetical protein
MSVPEHISKQKIVLPCIYSFSCFLARFGQKGVSMTAHMASIFGNEFKEHHGQLFFASGKTI